VAYYDREGHGPFMADVVATHGTAGAATMSPPIRDPAAVHLRVYPATSGPCWTEHDVPPGNQMGRHCYVPLQDAGIL